MNPVGEATDRATVPPQQIGDALERVLESNTFQQAEQLRGFLKFAVDTTLDGRAADIKEYTIGVEVFGRDEDFDPRSDTIVRVQASRLRAKLAEYYLNEEAEAPVRIELPKGTYVPIFHTRGVSRANAVPARKMLLVGGLFVVGLVGFYGFDQWRNPDRESSPGPIRSVAVLAFADLSGGDEQYFGDGLAEELTNLLSRCDGLEVTPRTSAFQFKNRPTSVEDIGRELEVDAIIQGSVRKSETSFRVTTQLIRATSGRTLWSETFDRPLGEIFEVQESLARSIAFELRARLRSEEVPDLLSTYKGNYELYDRYLRGTHLLRQSTESSLVSASQTFHSILEKDSTYVPAYAGLIDAYALLSFYGYAPTRELHDEARAAFERIRDLEQEIPEVHIAMALYHVLFEWDWSSSKQRLSSALVAAPEHPAAYALKSGFEAARGSLPQALVSARRASELDPTSLTAQTSLLRVLYLSRNYEQALSESESLLEWAPDAFLGNVIRCLSLARLGRVEDALRSIDDLERLQSRSPIALAISGEVLALTGEENRARTTLDELVAASELRYVSPTHIARVQLALGETEVALELLERALVERSIPIALLMSAPMFDPLRDTPAFSEILKETGLLDPQ